MVKFIIVGLWVCVVALGALVLGVRSQAGGTEKPDNAVMAARNLNQERAKLISVPIMVDGKVTGYIVARLVYTVDTNAASQFSVPLGFFVNDEIFRIFYGAYSDTRAVETVKFDDVRQKIINGVNQRFPEPVLKDLLVEQFNYIAANQVRDLKRRY